MNTANELNQIELHPMAPKLPEGVSLQSAEEMIGEVVAWAQNRGRNAVKPIE